MYVYKTPSKTQKIQSKIQALLEQKQRKIQEHNELIHRLDDMIADLEAERSKIHADARLEMELNPC